MLIDVAEKTPPSLKRFSLGFEHIIFFLYLVFLFSWDYHAAWLLYDFVLIIISLRVLRKKYIYKKNKLLFFLLLFLFIYFICSDYVNGISIISCLSLWDNFKHIILIFAYQDFKKRSDYRKNIFIDRLYLFTGTIFIFQLILVFFQYKIGYYYDDVSGSFGTQSSHIIGYFSVFYILFLFAKEASLFLKIFSLLAFVFINFAASNVGIFIFLAYTLGFLIFIKNKKHKITYLIFILILIGIFCLNSDLVSFWNEYILYRTNNFLSFSSDYIQDGLVGDNRPILMGYAIYVGGWFGKGFGAYSDIYSMQGSLLNGLINVNLPISTCTHLIAEIGVCGFFLAVAIYMAAIFYSVSNRIIALYLMGFALLAIFYNRFLNDERVFFMFFLVLIMLDILSVKVLKKG